MNEPVSVVRTLLTQQERGLLNVLYKTIKKMLLEQWLYKPCGFDFF